MTMIYPSRSWKDKRIEEINKMPYASNDEHPFFEEVMAIYKSKHRSYRSFKKDYETSSSS